jgi:ubiquinone/menaquinone biosynthesis C-methylase UbiE
MSEPSAYVQSLMVTYPLADPTARAAIQALRLPTGSRGLDAGCGIGLQALLLAQAVGPAGHITGLDLSPEHLACAREMVERAGLSDRISFREGDVRHLPFDDDTFDWAWSEDCVAYAPQLDLEPVPVLKELKRVVKPGGTVAILSWTSQMLLPGFPVLEARLNATSPGIAPFTAGSRPELHFPRALGWFRDAGLEELSVRTFVSDAHAPLSGELRSALLELFRERWPGAEQELTPEDRAEYRRICLPESPEFVLDHPDYYAFWTVSMFRGKVAAPAGF